LVKIATLFNWFSFCLLLGFLWFLWFLGFLWVFVGFLSGFCGVFVGFFVWNKELLAVTGTIQRIEELIIFILVAGQVFTGSVKFLKRKNGLLI